MGAVVHAAQEVREKVRRERVERALEPQPRHEHRLLLELLLAEPRVGHVLLDVVVVLVVLVVALRPRPEGDQERRVAKVPAHGVDPRVVAEGRVAAVVSCHNRS